MGDQRYCRADKFLMFLARRAAIVLMSIFLEGQ